MCLWYTVIVVAAAMPDAVSDLLVITGRWLILFSVIQGVMTLMELSLQPLLQSHRRHGVFHMRISMVLVLLMVMFHSP